MFSDSFRFALALVASLGVALTVQCAASAAENLQLRPGTSFTEDAGSNFPILGDKMDDAVIEPGKRNLIFFGAAGNLNTNRQAKRLCDLYKKNAANTKFIVIDIDNPANESAKTLIKKYYSGYVPTQLLIDVAGNQVWSQVGEVERGKLQSHLQTLEL